MSGLKQELGLAQGVGLLSTSLLGTGVFAVPALAALVAGDNSLWAWPALILLVFPIAIVFATLGRHFPSAGGVAHFVNMAFGPRLARVTGWLFLSVIPVGRVPRSQLQRQSTDVGCRADCRPDRRHLVARRDQSRADPLPGAR